MGTEPKYLLAMEVRYEWEVQYKIKEIGPVRAKPYSVSGSDTESTHAAVKHVCAYTMISLALHCSSMTLSPQLLYPILDSRSSQPASRRDLDQPHHTTPPVRPVPKPKPKPTPQARVKAPSLEQPKKERRMDT
ncbi:uncharacterized protein RSE6_10882 [Rhynchosporium secalis]|uniref:Uncharacterized protein n=1 Tax=Rhynchosporium secalis TaxID=38038 RepID=A0A1E1MLJ4_RHYSE|nr:uncharacterized protein RSE6_10882 [Rhynchosporium secalis]